MDLCAKAEIPRSFVNAMLTENVRKSLSTEAQQNEILSVSLDGMKFGHLNGQRTRCSVSPRDLGGPAKFAPTIRVNMLTAESARKLAQERKKVVVVLGTANGPLATFAGTTAAKTALQQGAGLAEAQKRATEEVSKLLQRTGEIFASLQKVAQEACEGRGEIA